MNVGDNTQKNGLILEQFEAYRAAFDAELVNFERVSRIDQVVDRIVISIGNNQPFSMARLGDGEGTCLFYEETGFLELREFSIIRSLILHFGGQRYTEETLSYFSQSMRHAVDFSDVVTYARNATVHHRMISCGSDDVRGYIGCTYSNRIVDTLPEKTNRLFYQDGYLHTALLPYYKRILEGQQVVLVSSASQEFAEALSRYYNFTLRAVISFPDQAVNVGSKMEKYLYPHHWTETQNKVRELARPGVVFIIAAGLTAKFLCSDVKECGGVAIDVGSVMDVWRGKGVRGYQNADFVDKHRIR